ncbi:MAG: DUF3592 domain-containing protein [Marinobacter sp.]|nr:DUF3592 domain-containing protein [Marinobacter sp.]
MIDPQGTGTDSGDKKQKEQSRLGITLFGLIFLLIGLGVLVFGPLHTLYEDAESAGWQRVPARRR